jgi:hypothetical protein
VRLPVWKKEKPAFRLKAGGKRFRNADSGISRTERVGVEPTVRLNTAHTISSRAPSATRSSLRRRQIFQRIYQEKRGQPTFSEAENIGSPRFSRIPAVSLQSPAGSLQSFHRRERDSNPRYRKRYNGFRGRRIRPLCHLSLVAVRLKFMKSRFPVSDGKIPISGFRNVRPGRRRLQAGGD